MFEGKRRFFASFLDISELQKKRKKRQKKTKKKALARDHSLYFFYTVQLYSLYIYKREDPAQTWKSSVRVLTVASLQDTRGGVKASSLETPLQWSGCLQVHQGGNWAGAAFGDPRTPEKAQRRLGGLQI